MLTNELNEITSNIVVEFFIGKIKESEDESWRAASNRLEIYIRIYTVDPHCLLLALE